MHNNRAATVRGVWFASRLQGLARPQKLRRVGIGDFALPPDIHLRGAAMLLDLGRGVPAVVQDDVLSNHGRMVYCNIILLMRRRTNCIQTRACPDLTASTLPLPVKVWSSIHIQYSQRSNKHHAHTFLAMISSTASQSLWYLSSKS